MTVRKEPNTSPGCLVGFLIVVVAVYLAGVVLSPETRGMMEQGRETESLAEPAST